MKEKMSLWLLNENLGRHLMCVVVVLGLIFGLSGGVNAAGTNVCGEQEQVVTIYFAGTGATEDWWDPSKSGFWTRELIATLYHENKSESPTHYSKFVDGIESICFPPSSEPFGCRGWNTCLTEAENFLDSVLQNSAGDVTLNLVGWSRGGVLTMMMAEEASSRERVKKINILAIDPVPGDPGFNNNYFCLNEKVNQYVGIYATDERSSMFTPAIPDFKGETKVWMFRVPGSHETLVGSTQEDGHSIELTCLQPLWICWAEHYNDTLDNVYWVTKVIAVELLGSSQWGNVEFNWNWHADLDNEEDIKNRFLDKVETMYDYPDYSLMHDYGFTPWLESYRYEVGFGLGCWGLAAFGAQHEPRCSYRWDCKGVGETNRLDYQFPPIDGGMGWLRLQALGNSPPVANANGPYEDDEGSAITFDASGSCDPDDDPLKYRWDFGNDGSWDTGWSNSSTASYTWGDDHTGTAKVEVNDGKFTDTATASITVNNVAPSVNAGNDQTVNEGDTVSFSGSFTDTGWLDTHTIEWDFGDGGTASGTLTPTHAYGDDGVYTVTLTVTDDDVGVGTDTLTVTVNNVAPTVEAGDDQTVDEGDTVSFSGSFTDPGADTHTIEWDFGDGGTATGTLTPTHAYGDNGVYMVTLTVTDDDVGVGSDTLAVTVNNVAPTVEAGDDQTVNEGDTVSFSGSFTDPGADTHTIEWDLGDGGTASGTLTPTHAYGDNGVYTLTLTITDDDGGVGTGTLTVTVNNVAPLVSIDSIEQPNPHFILPHHLLAFTGSFTDPGWLDTHTATWDFGDGTVVAGTLTEENEQPDSIGTSRTDHAYSEPRDYMVTLIVTDDDGGTGTDTSTVTIMSAEEAIPVMDDYIQDLPDDVFKNNPDQRKNAFSEKLDKVIELIDAGEYQKAIDKLQHDIRAKADGYVDGNPKNDWITDPRAQQEICTMIDDLVAYLETLL